MAWTIVNLGHFAVPASRLRPFYIFDSIQNYGITVWIGCFAWLGWGAPGRSECRLFELLDYFDFSLQDAQP
jgi:hypothetical protein